MIEVLWNVCITFSGEYTELTILAKSRFMGACVFLCFPNQGSERADVSVVSSYPFLDQETPLPPVYEDYLFNLLFTQPPTIVRPRFLLLFFPLILFQIQENLLII